MKRPRARRSSTSRRSSTASRPTGRRRRRSSSRRRSLSASSSRPDSTSPASSSITTPARPPADDVALSTGAARTSRTPSTACAARPRENSPMSSAEDAGSCSSIASTTTLNSSSARKIAAITAKTASRIAPKMSSRVHRGPGSGRSPVSRRLPAVAQRGNQRRPNFHLRAVGCGRLAPEHQRGRVRLRAVRALPFYIGGFLGPFGGGVVAVLVPQLRDAFDATTAGVAATLPAYLIPFAVFQLVSGTIGERIGRRKVVRTAFIAYALLSLAAAFAPTWRRSSSSARCRAPRTRSSRRCCWPAWRTSSHRASSGAPSGRSPRCRPRRSRSPRSAAGCSARWTGGSRSSSQVVVALGLALFPPHDAERRDAPAAPARRVHPPRRPAQRRGVHRLRGRDRHRVPRRRAGGRRVRARLDPARRPAGRASASPGCCSAGRRATPWTASAARRSSSSASRSAPCWSSRSASHPQRSRWARCGSRSGSAPR